MRRGEELAPVETPVLRDKPALPGIVSQPGWCCSDFCRWMKEVVIVVEVGAE